MKEIETFDPDIPFRMDLQLFAGEGEGEGEGGEGKEGQGEGGEGKDKDAWKAQLKEGLRDNEAFDQFSSVTDLGKSYLELQEKAKGAEGAVKIPGEKSTDQEKAEFFKKIGRPDSPDEYELKDPELPEGLEINKEFKKGYQNTVHMLNLTKDQAEKLYDWYHIILLDTLDELTKLSEEELKTAEEGIRKEYGKNYNANVKLAHEAILQFGGDDLFDLFEKVKVGGRKLGSLPGMVRTFVNIGKKMGEHTFVKGEKEGEPTGIEATGQLDYDKSPELKNK